jgi:hypothetical protein
MGWDQRDQLGAERLEGAQLQRSGLGRLGPLAGAGEQGGDEDR